MASSTPTVGEGCFGKVYKKQFGDKWAAVKRVPVGYISKQQLIRECKVYDNAQHPNVVKLLGEPWLINFQWNIPLEFIFGEDLETTLFKTKNSKIKLTSAVKDKIINGMCEGLLHLHSKDIVHQDLKPDNIMVEHQTHRAVIIDMGLAKFFKNGLSSAANLGNEAYSAPEILRRGVRDKCSDVWAMGKIIAELCLNVRLLTQHMSTSTILEFLKESLYCIPVSRMTNDIPLFRATMAEVISDIREAKANYNIDDWLAIIRNANVKLPDSQMSNPLEEPSQQFFRPTFHSQLSPQVVPFFSGQQAPQFMPFFSDLPFQQVVPCFSDLPSQQVVPFFNPIDRSQFPCTLPDSGKVSEDCYDAEKATLVHKEITTKGGKIIKYKKVEITKHP